MDEFQIGPYETAVGDAEMLVEIRVPVRPDGGSAYEKVERRAGDWAIVAAGAAIWMDGSTIADAGIALAAVGPTTVHVTRGEAALRGQAPSEEAFAQAAAIAAEDCSPADDTRGPIDYKRHLARELTHRALRRAAARALHQEA
jgi:carbon-monoxide dehydrogenase medium subunit